jgi:hypothetical protein
VNQDIKKFVPASQFAHLDPDEALGEGILGGFTSLSYRGKVWRLRHGGNEYMFVRDDDGTQIPYIDVVILARSPDISKVYYPGQYEEDRTGPPVCTSLRGDKPDPGVPEPQADCCAICPHNAWTTLPTGRRGKECQDHRRVAVMLLPTVTKKLLGAPLYEPVFLKIPPGSLPAFKAYGRELRDIRAHFASLVTRIGFDPDPKKLFALQFRRGHPLSNSDADVILPLLSSPETKRLIGDAPVIREIEGPSAPAKQQIIRPAKIDTGLTAAFGVEEKPVTLDPRFMPLGLAGGEQASERKRPVGRPKGSGRKHALAQLEQIAVEQKAQAEEAVQAEAEAEPMPEAAFASVSEDEQQHEDEPVNPETGELGAWAESDEELDRRVRAITNK